MSMLETRNLHVSIAGKLVCQQLDLQIDAGQVWGILGRNGIGKTTLLHTLAGLRKPDSGNILLQHKDIQQFSRKQLAQNIGVLLQQQEDAFPSSVFETVLGGRHPHIDHWHWESSNDHKIANQALQLVNMLELSRRQTNQLSGGERQRVAIATLLSQDPKLFLLDEPNSHLDLNYQISVLHYLTQLAQQQQRSIIMSLHDINLVARFCSHVLLLYGNGRTEAGPVDNLLEPTRLENIFQHPVNTHKANGKTVFWPG